MSLREMEVRKAKLKEKPYRLNDTLGLHLLVKPNGSKLWQQRYQYLGKEKTMSHGAYSVEKLDLI
jgi:Arm domain-containing DNA-binding protein